MLDKNDPKVIVALDFNSLDRCYQLVEKLHPSMCKLKVGKEMFTLFGPSLVEGLIKKNFDVFLDLKFHDIPNTVAKACAAAADLGVWMVNVHASGGRKMMESAANAISSYGNSKPLITAVTVLTSMDQSQLNGVVGNVALHDQVLKLAKLTEESGLDGVVCSAQEAKMLRQHVSSNFKLITPGIRTKSSSSDDQIRIMTPSNAIIAGVSYMVIGRPITQSPQPDITLRDINLEITHALEM